MQLYIKKAFSVLLVACMIALTAGISVYRHYCNCTRQMTTSFLPDVACDTMTHTSACEHNRPENQASCCSTSSTTKNPDQEHCNSSGCCQTIKSFISLESEYQVSTIHDLAINLFPIFCMFSDYALPDHESVLLTSIFIADISPPCYGRDLLTSLHQLKFDIPVC